MAAWRSIGEIASWVKQNPIAGCCLHPVGLKWRSWDGKGVDAETEPGWLDYAAKAENQQAET
jgi:hypothetical protein